MYNFYFIIKFYDRSINFFISYYYTSNNIYRGFEMNKKNVGRPRSAGKRDCIFIRGCEDTLDEIRRLMPKNLLDRSSLFLSSLRMLDNSKRRIEKENLKIKLKKLEESDVKT